MKRIILVFGAIVILLMLLFQTSKLLWMNSDYKAEWILAVLALVSLGVGIWVSRYSSPKPKLEPWQQDLEKIEELGISKRELEVWKLCPMDCRIKRLVNAYLSQKVL